MKWWKPKDPQATTQLRFITKPNTYNTDSTEGKCPICDELDVMKTRLDKIKKFIVNIGAEDNAVGKAILKATNDKNTTLESYMTKPTVQLNQPIPSNWGSMKIHEKMQWCITNLDADALLTKMIKTEFDKQSTIIGGSSDTINKSGYSSIVGGKDNVINKSSDILPNDIKKSSDIERSADRIISITKADKTESKPHLTTRKVNRTPQLTTKFNLTVDYIKQNIMPILYKYSMHEVDAFSALFARFRSDPDYGVALTVSDFTVFKMTPEMAINMVVHLYEQGHLVKK